MDRLELDTMGSGGREDSGRILGVPLRAGGMAALSVMDRKDTPDSQAEIAEVWMDRDMVVALRKWLDDLLG